MYSLKSKSRNIFISVFIIPPLLLFAIFILIPMIQGLYLGLFEFKGFSSSTFVGFKNFAKLIKDPIMYKSIYNDLFIALISTAITIPIALFLSTTLSLSKIKGSGFFKTVMFFPSVMSLVIVVTIWIMMLSPSFGVINTLLMKLGLISQEVAWIGQEDTVLWSIVFIKVWAAIGFYVVILSAAIGGIPEELFDASKIDGASMIRNIVNVVLPLIRGQINFCIIIMMIGSINGSFTMIMLLTEGGPNHASTVMGFYLWENAYRYSQQGYAAAIGVIILAVTMILYLISKKLLNQETYQY